MTRGCCRSSKGTGPVGGSGSGMKSMPRHREDSLSTLKDSVEEHNNALLLSRYVWDNMGTVIMHRLTNVISELQNPALSLSLSRHSKQELRLGRIRPSSNVENTPCCCYLNVSFTSNKSL